MAYRLRESNYGIAEAPVAFALGTEANAVHLGRLLAVGASRPGGTEPKRLKN
jgi:hypothetical protein